jgi:hypothetical protein
VRGPLIRIVFILLGTSLVATEVVWFRQQRRGGAVARSVLAGIAVVFLLFTGLLWVNHVRFPLNLDLMEGTVLQHFQRAAEFKAIYPEPTPAYVPLAYNPLYYVLGVPFSWLFGVNLFTLRLVAVLGTLGSSLILFRVVQEKTASTWWGLVAIGLFAASYRAMDAYLDTAHADSWLICAVLLGSFVIARKRSRAWNLVGVIILTAAFWFKQHGALFTIGGVLFLTWREGLRRAWVYWLVAALLGPGLYILAGPRLFGSHFHYFTWEVPGNWSELDVWTFLRVGAFTLKSYPILSASAALTTAWVVLRDRDELDIWPVQFICAALTGLIGSLDPGASYNVYIPMATWFILLGTLGLHKLGAEVGLVRRYQLHLVALFATFGMLLYDPAAVITSPRAGDSYTDLVDMLEGLEGSVYAPSLGQLQSGYVFYPAAHWVALEDMIRGPGRDTRNHPKTRPLLDPALHPKGEAYILANKPLSGFPWLAFLEDYYVMEIDFGDRFEPLRVLPARWDHGWPRYLYRYAPSEAAARANRLADSGTTRQ